MAIKSSHKEAVRPSDCVLLPAEEFRYIDAPFPNKRLAYIRVMTIHPALLFNTVLECDIEAVELTPAANYEALSYSWQMESCEDPNLRRVILLNGKTKHITRNLYEGLLRLRREAWPKSRRLWVDAICINQSNPEEQSRQVSQMSLVYGYASRTVVWLGEGEDPREDRNAHAVFACCMAKYNTLFHPCIRHIWRGSDGSCHSICGLELDKHRKFYQGEMDVVHRTKVAMTVMRFFSKRYFKRRWILQELRNSDADLTRVHWGPFTCSFSDISHTVHRVQFFQSLSRAQVNSTHASRSDRELLDDIEVVIELLKLVCCRRWNSMRIQNGSARISFEEFLWLLMYCRMACSDLRDLSYSLLNIGPDLGIQPNYSYTKAMVFTELARKLIEYGGLKLVLWHSRGLSTPCRIDDLPTWVPDFDCMRGIEPSRRHRILGYNKVGRRIVYFGNAFFDDNVTLNIAPYDYGVIRTATSGDDLREIDLSWYLSETMLEDSESPTYTSSDKLLLDAPDQVELPNPKRRIRDHDGDRILCHSVGSNLHRAEVMPGDYCFTLEYGLLKKGDTLLIMRRIDEERAVFKLVTEVQLTDCRIPEVSRPLDWWKNPPDDRRRRVCIEVK